MIISDTAIKNRVSVVILAILIIIIGIYCYNVLPREDEPDITIPYVFVSTSYKGVASSDIETSITIPIEKKLKGLEGVKNISSSSSEGQSDINIEFVPGTDIDDVLQKVKNKVDEAKGDLPNDMENDPAVFEVNLSEMPIVVYSISGTCSLTSLKRIADELEEDIESIPGVLEANVSGGREREIVIEANPDKLAYYHIPITAFSSVVSSENANTSGGAITLGEGRYQIRVPGEFKSPDEIYNIVISTFNGQPIYLKDVARVVDSFKDEDSRSRLNGRSSVQVTVKKRSGENIITIIDAADELMEIKKHSWPTGTTVTKMMDKAKGIRMMVADLENNILSGLALVILVLLFALGVRNAILVGIAIPFSMLLSFAVLKLMGVTLNMVVLFSLSLALGMLVDNAIVIVENIYRYMEQGVPRVEAAMKGTGEVAYPVIGSTLTTLAAFFPMLFWPGIMGEFMSYLPLTLIVTLTSSLFVAMVINPALTSFLMKVKTNVSAKPADEIASSGEKPIEIKGFFLKTYSAILKTSLDNRIAVMVISFMVLIISAMAWLYSVGIERPTEFFPSIDPNNAYVNIEPPEGADIEYTDRIVKKVEMAICGLNQDYSNNDLPFPIEYYEEAFQSKDHKTLSGEDIKGPSDLANIEYISTVVKRSASGSVFSSTSPTHIGIQFIDLEDRQSKSAEDLKTLRERFKNIAGAKITIEEQQGGPPTGAPINIEISGDDFQVLGKLSEEVKAVLANIPAVKDVKDTYMNSIPSIQIKIDRQKAAMFGLSTNAIGFALKTAYNGSNISTYREGGEDYDITVKLSEDNRKITDVLYNLMIPTQTGQLVPLTTLAHISYTGTIGDITRINHERVVTVKANVDETQTTSSNALAEANKFLEGFHLPTGYKIKFTGQQEHEKESLEFLTKALLIAMLLIFLILVTLFNSISQPVIIMFSALLSLGGVFLGLYIKDFSFGIIMTFVGVISLVGVVVNNAIVLIDYTNKLRERGLSLNDAIVSAGATRLRPVILTAITTILGLIPMVTGVSIDFRELIMSMIEMYTQYLSIFIMIFIMGSLIAIIFRKLRSGTIVTMAFLLILLPMGASVYFNIDTCISLISESSQYWESMATVVIYGLLIATFLTLVVVPVLFSLFATTPIRIKKITRFILDSLRVPLGSLSK